MAVVAAPSVVPQQGAVVSEPSPVLDLPELLSDGFIDTYTGDSSA